MRRTVRRILLASAWLTVMGLALSSPMHTMRDAGLSWLEVFLALALSAGAFLVISAAAVAVATIICWAWEDPEDLKEGR